MNKQTRWILIFVLLLVFSSLACQTLLGDDDSEPEVEPAEVTPAVAADAPVTEAAEDELEEPTEEPVEEETSDTVANDNESEEELSIEDSDISFAAPLEANSYRIAFSMAITVNEESDSIPVISIKGDGAVTNDPQASSFTFQALGIEDAESFSNMTIVQIEDATYFVLPTGGCFSGLFSLDDFPFDDFTQGSNLAEGMSEATLVERNVEINGINTDHYSFSPDDVGSNSFFDDSIQNFEGNLYVSDDGYLVRITFSGEGGVDLSGLVPIEGSRVSYQLDYSELNEPIEITVPEGCSESEATDLPVVEDAYDLNSFAGVTGYSSNLSFDEIVEFYRTEMSAEGWSLDQEFTSGNIASLTFSQNDATVLVTIEEDTVNGQVTVVLLEE